MYLSDGRNPNVALAALHHCAAAGLQALKPMLRTWEKATFGLAGREDSGRVGVARRGISGHDGFLLTFARSGADWDLPYACLLRNPSALDARC